MSFLRNNINQNLNNFDNNVTKTDETPNNTPRIGIFWLHLKEGKIEIFYSRTMIPELGCTYGTYILDPAGHFEIWESLKVDDIIPRNTNYDDLPRGRVSYDQNKKQYVVYHGSYIKSSTCIRQAIKYKFKLKRNTRWEPDLHYDKFKWWGI